MAAEALPSLKGVPFLDDPGVRAVFAALAPGARIVGGAVRNALLGEPPGDIDFGTPLPPDAVMRAAAAAGLRAIPTGAEHGTVTLLAGGQAFQVTALREDVETDGRHAVVRFGDDWAADARRRDFTLNALSLTEDGTVFDPVGGYPDLLARRVRFIGDADARIAEDRLRILRFFRLHARYGAGAPDAEGLAASIRARGTLKLLSAERVGHEMRKLAVAPGAAATLAAMTASGILATVLGDRCDLVAFRRLAEFFRMAGAGLPAELGLAALAGARGNAEVVPLADRLRLSGAERDRVLAALAASADMAMPPAGRNARRLLYRHGPASFRDGMAMAFATSSDAGDSPGTAWSEAWRVAATWPVPRFPLSGRDVLATGILSGPQIGAVLADLENWWIEQDFRPDAETLRRRLQAFAAAQQ